MSGSYRGSGSASYHPSLLLGILVYGYATGVFSSRKLERATYRTFNDLNGVSYPTLSTQPSSSSPSL
jgi:transposase